jgi:D-lactate dehydrogenase (cytochrome)
MSGVFQTGGIDTYLRDESGITGQAEAIALPETPEELQQAMKASGGKPLVFQGARTGFCGGAVPQGGLIINFIRMTGMSDFSYDPAAGTGAITLRAGVTLEELNAALEKKQTDTSLFDGEALKNWRMYQEAKTKLMFRPNPSEQSATLGGIAATGASGSRWGGELSGVILELSMVLSGGHVLRIKGGEARKTPDPGGPESLDLISGSEGLFGAVSELKLALEEKPAEQYGLMAYFTDYRQIPIFMDLMKTDLQAIPGAHILASDFFDLSCAAFTGNAAGNAAPLLPELAAYPGFPPDTAAALWMELGGSEEALFGVLEAAMVDLEKSGALADETLAATDSRDFVRLGRLRHLLTEAFNLLDAGVPPVLLDLIAPEQKWPEAARFISSRARERSLPFTLMGHTGDCRISLRMPGVSGEAKGLAEELTAEFAAAGYRCSREHGIGRIKKKSFRLLCPDKAASLAILKKKLDPARHLNAGVLIDPGE